MTTGTERPALLQVVLSLGAGGTERLVIDMSLALRERAAVQVVCLDEAGAWAPALLDAGIPVTALHRAPGFQLRLAGQIRALARASGAGVLHCHHYSPFIYGCLAGLTLPGTRVVYTEHGRLSDAGPSAKRRLVNGFFGRTPGHFFAVSAHLREHMLAEGFPAARLAVNHNGIDPGTPRDATRRAAARERLGLAADDWVVGTVARLDPVKDLGTLLHAAAGLITTQPRLRVVLVGDGPEREALQALAARLGIAERVVFAGQRDDARALLDALDAFVNCSVMEGISITILEALAAGLPVVATAVGGNGEIIAHEAHGLLTPARAPEALTAALARLAADPALAGRLALAGRERLVGQFSRERMLGRYVEAYGWAAPGA